MTPHWRPIWFGLLALFAMPVHADVSKTPNLVYVLCDDLGYGDVKCLNPQRCSLETPHIDRLASQGMVFTDAHSSSSVCTPTRYGIMTGRYNWRTTLQQGVLEGFSKPLIDAKRLTVAKWFKQQGYHTACIGKWHLGMEFTKEGKAYDFTKPITGGPVDCGFDEYFGISASLDMPPFAFIRNDHFTQLPTVRKKWMRSGPAAPDFEAVDVLPTLVTQACDYLHARAADKKPFFLYLPLPSPHTPLVPGKEWAGKSPIGPYGDYVMQTDAVLGQVMTALEQSGLADNTIVIFTSDNGFAPYVGVHEIEQKGHFPSADLRGYKSDLWEGGHRIPFIVRWPGHVKPQTTCPQLICLTDLMATCADILGAKLPETAAEDSVSILPALNGRVDQPLREAVVHHSMSGRFSIRQDKWKLLLSPGSGGWSAPKDAEAAKRGLPKVQLYDMTMDASEARNLEADHPEVVARLLKLLEQYVAKGRSTPGPDLSNDVPVDIWKH